MIERGDRETELARRLAAVESRLAELHAEVRTRRVTLVGDDGEGRLVGEIVRGVTELRLDLPGRPPGRRTSLLLFAAPEQRDWCAGLGVQLWADGNLVDELTWWADQDGAPAPQDDHPPEPDGDHPPEPEGDHPREPSPPPAS